MEKNGKTLEILFAKETPYVFVAEKQKNETKENSTFITLFHLKNLDTFAGLMLINILT